MSDTEVERALSLLVQAARVSPPLRDAVAAVEAELRRLEAECERHRRANLVRAVVDGWDEALDGGLTDYINEHGWDAVPWKIAEGALQKKPNPSPGTGAVRDG